MADTIGSLIDKLNTVDFKMWNNQELIYKIRKMTFDDYKKEYFSSEEGAKILWSSLKKACDLNIQRNQIIDEIDEKIIQLVKDSINKEELNGKYIQRKYKTI